MFERRSTVFLILAALSVPLVASSGYLFYLEAQAVGGWSSAARKAIFYSMSPQEPMQKPSIGFDWLQRFSSSAGDFALLAVQLRLAYDQEGPGQLDVQLYNAYLRFKLRGGGLWFGHHKPRFGLATTLDNHGTLLQPLSMMGFGFDRDWGLGYDRDFANGGIGVSLTTGSGMDVRLGGNFLAAARLTRGVLNRDNRSLGVSLAFGRILDDMAAGAHTAGPQSFFMLGGEGSWLSDNWEHAVELMAGVRDGRAALAVFWRSGVGLLAERRLKLEVQPALMLLHGQTHLQLAGGASWLAAPDWTLRAMLAYNGATEDARLVVQVYYYKGVRF